MTIICLLLRKKQLTPIEISFLSWWVKNGADFDKTLAELNLPDSLQEFITPTAKNTINKLVPQEDISKADPNVLEKLSLQNVLISPIASNSNYLSVSFMNVLPEKLTAVIEECTKLKQQIVWLKHRLSKYRFAGLETIRPFNQCEKIKCKKQQYQR